MISCINLLLLSRRRAIEMSRKPHHTTYLSRYVGTTKNRHSTCSAALEYPVSREKGGAGLERRAKSKVRVSTQSPRRCHKGIDSVTCANRTLFLVLRHVTYCK